MLDQMFKLIYNAVALFGSVLLATILVSFLSIESGLMNAIALAACSIGFFLMSKKA